LEQQVRALKQQVEALEQQVEAVGRKLEEAVRAGKRQAGPFSKGPPKVNPQKPGQKEGHTAVHRAVPTKIDQTLKALLPAHCECGGVIVADEVQQQWPLRGPLYQVDIPRPKVALRGAIPTKVTQWPLEGPPFDVSIGHCECCGKRHQGRHAEQTSDAPKGPAALGAAGVQIGPNVMAPRRATLAWSAELKHGFGISYGKIAQLLSSACGLTVNGPSEGHFRSTLVRGDERIAQQLIPTYEQLILRLRDSVVVYGDETSWRINGGKAWLWVFSNDDVAVYTMAPRSLAARSRGWATFDPTRAHQVVKRILGTDFKGVLKCDCFLAYDDADLAAIEQSKCLGHLLRRCSEVGESTTGRAVVFSRQVTKLLRAAMAPRSLAARSRGWATFALKKRQTDLTPHGYLVARGRLEAGLDRLLQGNYTDPENAKLAKLLRKHRHQLFGFLAIPELDATNNAADGPSEGHLRDIRPGVIVRKTKSGPSRGHGCNRAPLGARTHEIIARNTPKWPFEGPSRGCVFRTCVKQGKDFVAHVADLLRNPNTPALNIVPPNAAAPAPS